MTSVRVATGAARALVRDPAIAALTVLIVSWTAVFAWLGAVRHAHFGTFGFDLGIYDQGTWLLSTFRDPFVTVRGIDLFGHHVNVVLLAVAPGYWVGGGPYLLLALQLASQASGAVAVFLLARDRVGSRVTAVVLAAVLLLNPTYQWLVWEYFHPDALAIAPLLFAYWAARAGRWRWFWVAVVLALACKEDLALPLAVLGLVLLVRGERRRGALLAAASGVWFVVATRVVIPAFNGIGPFYDTFFGPLGDSPAEVVWNSVRHPSRTWDLLREGTRLSWYWRMLAPFAWLPVLAPDALVIAVPTVLVNALTAYPYTRDYRFHYSAIVLAGTTIATVEAVAWIARRRPRLHVPVLVVLVACALGSTVAWGASPLARDFDGIWPLERDALDGARRAAIRAVPDDAGVSATYNVVPHLAHRARVYEFPVPWCNVSWGVHGEHLDDPALVDWLVVDTSVLGIAERARLDVLLEDEFAVRYERGEGDARVLAAERVAESRWGPADAPFDCRHPEPATP